MSARRTAESGIAGRWSGAENAFELRDWLPELVLAESVQASVSNTARPSHAR